LRTVVQPHGFEADESGSEADAIVSSGTATISDRARRVHARLIGAGFASCLYRSAACRQLARPRTFRASTRARPAGSSCTSS